MVRVRFVEVVAVAALAGSLAACGGSSTKSATAPVTVTSTVQAAPSSSATTTAAAGGGATTTAASSTTAPAAPSSTHPAAASSSTAADGGGVANAGDHVTILGTLQYLAPGKFIVHPDDGSTDQAFYVSDATQILGAAVICGGPDGHVTIGGDDYGTTKCTEAELEDAAKKNFVKIRVVMNPKTGDVSSVEEKYHP